MTQQTLAIDPNEQVLAHQAALDLRALGLPANGVFLSAATELTALGSVVSPATLADALHQEAR